MNTLSKISKISFVIGAACLGYSLYVGLNRLQSFFEAYLVGFLIIASFPLGALAISMVHYLTHGSWGFVIRRYYLGAIKTLPLVTVLVIPILYGIPYLYLWANPEVVAHDHILQQKAIYLNPTMFIARTIFYFVSWLILSIILYRKSVVGIHDTTDAGRTRMQLVGGLGIVFFVLTMTFAAFDWAMSIEPHWYSTIFGIFTVISQALSALALMIVFATIETGGYAEDGKKMANGFHDLGNLALALVMLWAYMAFSQFIIIWSGNLPEEIHWYMHRFEGGWKCIGSALMLFHFFVPFFLLLNRTIKRSPKVLALIALFILIMRTVDVTWIILPTFRHGLSDLMTIHITLPIGLIGLWLSYFIYKLKANS